MADVGSSIFNKKATEKLRSPDDLDKYVRVTNPSVWVVLGACIALLAGMLAWGVFGSVTTSVTAMGVVIDAEDDGSSSPIPICYLSGNDIGKVHEGDAAVIGGASMKVVDVADAPMSKAEAALLLTNDYLVSSLVKEDWAYLVTFEGDTSGLKQNVPLSVNITVERIAPLSLILKGRV